MFMFASILNASTAVAWMQADAPFKVHIPVRPKTYFYLYIHTKWFNLCSVQPGVPVWECQVTRSLSSHKIWQLQPMEINKWVWIGREYLTTMCRQTGMCEELAIWQGSCTNPNYAVSLAGWQHFESHCYIAHNFIRVPKIFERKSLTTMPVFVVIGWTIITSDDLCLQRCRTCCSCGRTQNY